jgi:hypothetical protein
VLNNHQKISPQNAVAISMARNGEVKPYEYGLISQRYSHDLPGISDMSQAFQQLEMPAVFCLADSQWIGEQLQSLSLAAKQKAMQRYAAVYQETFEAEPVSTARRTGQGMKQTQGFACL